jgi:hypothetical protein
VENKKDRTGKFTFFDIDLLLLGLPVCFAILFLIDSRSYNPTAALFPRLVATITLGLLFGALIQHYVRLYRQARQIPEMEEAGTESERSGGIKWYLNLAIILAYFLLIYVVGFIWASLLYLLATPIIMGYRKFKIVVVIALFWVIIFIYVFYELLQARIPKGLLEQIIQKMISS